MQAMLRAMSSYNVSNDMPESPTIAFTQHEGQKYILLQSHVPKARMLLRMEDVHGGQEAFQ